MHDIGAACGISGPAIYKHFSGKDDVLNRCLVGISERLLAEGEARASATADAADLLEALIDWHTEFALSEPALITIQISEWNNLDVEGRATVRKLQLAYIDLWVDTVRRLRDDVDAAEARAIVQATFGLLNSTPHSARISEEAMRSRLTSMARAALMA